MIPSEVLEEMVCNDLCGFTSGWDNIGMPISATNENPVLPIKNTIDPRESRRDYLSAHRVDDGKERGEYLRSHYARPSPAPDRIDSYPRPAGML
jgi:hypothetical protein